jgi:hypothetical protein
MNSNYAYSIKVNEALRSYGARTHGSLDRRVERLKRFTDMKNRQYADEIKIEHARMMANQEREERVKNRVRELQSPPVFLRRNLKKEFDNAAGWYAMGSPNYLKNTNTIKMKKEAYLAEPSQQVEIPMTSRRPSHSYNLRSRQESGLTALWQAIQNGFVNVNRG